MFPTGQYWGQNTSIINRREVKDSSLRKLAGDAKLDKTKGPQLAGQTS